MIAPPLSPMSNFDIGAEEPRHDYECLVTPGSARLREEPGR